MKDAEEIKRILHANRSRLAARYGIRRLGLFGSLVRGEQNRRSDVDILVEYNRTPGLVDFVRLKNELSELLDCRVDLVLKSALKPNASRRILAEVVYL